MQEETDAAAPASGFGGLDLPEALLQVLREVGYESPSPIQAQTIPHLLAGRDLLGQAQTGTGKTAAFALPILARLDLDRRPPQALVLTPTRELGIQVAEAFQRYAAHLPGFHVLPIYGGQSYGPQLSALQPRRARHRRHARPHHRPPRSRLARPLAAEVTSCSTRPTRCCAWASSTTSRRSCARPRRSGRPACSRRPCRPRSVASPRPTCASRSRSRSPPRRAPPTTSASASGRSAACTSSTP